MSKNMRHRSQDGQGVILALPVPATATNGNPVALGTDGLIGILETDRRNDSLLATVRQPQGLNDGEASVLLPGVGHTRDFGALPAGIAQYGKVYWNAATGISATDTDTFIGWRIKNLVGVRNNG